MTASITYEGGLRAAARHLKSGNTILTDAPTDNHGRGEAFSPTDLVAAALAACKMTMIGILIEQGRLPNLMMHASVNKVMANAPRRIGRLQVLLEISGATLTPEHKRLLEATAEACPVAKSLADGIERLVEYRYL